MQSVAVRRRPAGRVGPLGVEIMRGLIHHHFLAGGDGRFSPDQATRDRLSASGNDVAYHLTDAGKYSW